MGVLDRASAGSRRFIARGVVVAAVVLMAPPVGGLGVAGTTSPAAADAGCHGYADPAGNDANSGATPAQAKRSPLALLGVIGPGQTGCLTDGAMFTFDDFAAVTSAAGTPGAPKTLRPATPGARATITTSTGFLFTAASHDLVVRDIDFRRHATTGNGSLLLVDGDRITLDGVDLSYPHNICLDVGGDPRAGAADPTEDFVLRNSRVHHCGASYGPPRSEFDSGVHGIYLAYLRDGADVDSTSAILEQNLIYANHNRGLQLYPDADDVLVRFNLLHGNGSNLNLGSEGAIASQRNVVTQNILSDSVLSGLQPEGFNGDSSDVVGNYAVVLDPGNHVDGNCIANAAHPTEIYEGIGYTRVGNIENQAPGYANAAAGDFRLPPGSPCAGLGPSSIQPSSAPVDTNGDGRTDVAVFRPSTGRWYVQGVAGSVLLGLPGDVPVPGNYDADPLADLAVFRPSTGRWYVQGMAGSVALGLPGDVPVPGNYDADPATDMAVYRPSSGRWYIDGTAGATVYGVPGDIPVPGNYDADPATDLAVFRPSTGRWYVQGVAGSVALGVPGDIPVPGSYDADPATDLAVFRPSTGRWYVQGAPAAAAFGVTGDIPVPGSYDADPATDLAVFRPSTGRWFVQDTPGSAVFGTSEDIPLPLPAAVYNQFFGTTMALVGAVTDNYKACYNADPNAFERRTWFPVRVIVARGRVFTSSGTALVDAATGLHVTSASGGPTAILRATAGPPSTAFGNGSFRAHPSQFGYLGLVTSRAALQANPLQVRLVLTEGTTTIGDLTVSYVFDPALGDDPPGTLEHNGPAGRWTVRGAPTPLNWELEPQSC